MHPGLEAALRAYEARTPKSRVVWQHAKEWTPLGVHSNYRSLDPYPFYVRRASGVHLWDVDDNQYLDFNMGFGGLQSGHAHPAIVEALTRQLADGSLYGYEWERTPEAAERICRRFGMDKVRFSSTGLEATHHAMRIARATTGHRYILKFEGGYHGSHDTLLVGVKPRVEDAGPADRPNSAPASRGILPESAERTLVAPFNDLEATRAIAREHAKDLAAIITEPIPMNMGFVMPEEGFLPGLRELADELGALLVFDEIKTGAKYPHGGAGRLGVRPDIMLLGKSIACGAPLSAIAARNGVLDDVGPRKIAHAGTFNANPLSIACCLATLEHILTEEALTRSARLNAKLAAGYSEVMRDRKVTAIVAADGVSGTVFFTDRPVRDWRSFLEVDGERSMLYYYLCLNRGLIPSGTGPDEQWTIAVVHTESDVARHLSLLDSVASELSGTVAAGGIEESV
ncbi:MAG: aminotransferase class III-fold pyridoxal phosphate-dependent enzyme [Thermoplasmata archaeon]|nr:aminotransferase class III-fold pyridoxal phosphate-dependent enzyme [Thermoplasmata archaeon]